MHVWDLIVDHWVDIVIGAVFAVIFGVIIDLLKIGSRVRAVFRHLKNKLAEQSVESLRTRIAQQEKSRDRIASFLSSDKALYLYTLRYIIAILILICVAAGASVFNDLLALNKVVPGLRLILFGRVMSFPVNFKVVALLIFALAAVLGIYSIRIASWDTHAKISKVVTKFDDEIAVMKRKLEARTRRD
jgi:hypothetical protein